MTTTLQTQLQASLDSHYPHWAISDLRPIGNGLENLVFHAHSRAFGPIAIRVPWSRDISNINDPYINTRESLKQEAAIANHLSQHGVPVPAVHALHLGADLDFLVSAFIQSDGSTANSEEIGRVAALIHQAPAPDLHLVGMEGKPLPELLAERLTRRTHLARLITGRELSLPDEKTLQTALSYAAPRKLLHMDLRPANFLAVNGRALAVIDWGNALLGDPALDLARAIETGEVDQERFLAGYGDPSPFCRIPKHVELIYRLDTVIMLLGVFIEEAPDRAKAVHYLHMAQELTTALHQELS